MNLSLHWRRALRPAGIDGWGSILAASTLYSVGVLYMLLAPALMATLVDSWQLQGTQLGLWAGFYPLGFGIASLSSIFWINRFRWRDSAVVGLVMIAVAAVAQAISQSFGQLLVFTLISGLGGGISAATALAVLGTGRNPQHGFGVMILVSVAVPSMMMPLIPYAVSLTGFTSAVAAIAVVSILACAVTPKLPTSIKGQADDSQPNGPDIAPVAANPPPADGLFFGLLAITIFGGAFVGAWSFIERIGNESGLPLQSIMNCLALAQIAGGFGGFLGNAMAAYIGMRRSFLLASLVTIGSISTMQFLAASTILYGLLTAAFQLFLNAMFCFLLSFNSKLDPSGRYVAMIPGLQAAGTLAVTYFIGLAYDLAGGAGIVSIAVAGFALSTLAMIPALQKASIA